MFEKVENMSKNIYSKFLIGVLTLLCSGITVSAQAYGSYTPYSIFGVGDLYGEGTAYNRSMAGVGVAGRDNHFLNPVNPAAITARDSLAFMADVSIYQEDKIFHQGGMKSASNITNVGDLLISFPIYRSSAMMMGVMPFSSTGFGYISSYDDSSLTPEMGSISYTGSGQGGLYQAFVAGAVTFWDKLSLGAEAIYIFGNNQKTYYETISEASYLGAKNGYDVILNGLTGKFGIQFEQKVGSGKLTAGATYRMSTKLNGSVDAYRYSTGSAATDTLYHSFSNLAGYASPVSLGDELGVGLSYRTERWMAEIDYVRSDWTSSGMDKTDGFAGNLIPGTSSSIFTTNVSNAVRAGFEFIPNKSDIRYYFNRCAYRAGVFWKSDYFKLDGSDINSYGLTFGMTLPVFRWYNGLTLGVELGRRGTRQNNLISENYIKFNIGLSIFDIWFQQPKYD